MNSAFTFPAQSEALESFKFPIKEENDITTSQSASQIPNGAQSRSHNGGYMLESNQDVLPPTIDIPPPVESIEEIAQVSSKTNPNANIEEIVLADDFIPVPGASPEQISAITPTETTSRSLAEEYVSNLRQQLATDWKSPSEYALHVLFTKFVRHAESKLNLCLQHPLISEPPIVDILGEGVDPVFDKIIESLGHIAKRKPKPVIDAMMFWRKTKSEIARVATELVEKLLREYENEQTRTNPRNNHMVQTAVPMAHSKSLSNGSRFTHKRNSSSKSSAGSRSGIEGSRFRELESQIESAKATALKADRKSLISIYILCRVLIEIVKQSSGEGDEDLSDKLEEIVFTQLKTTDPLSISSSIIKSSNWNSFAELLGWMSEKKFLSVSDRFVADLEKIPTYINRNLEPAVHLLILGMRYLRLKNYPLERFEETADFIKSIAKFFSRAENISVSLAYAEVISQLLLPLAGTLTAEVNHPIWVEAMTTLLAAGSKLLSDSKYWASGFKLTISVLCASPSELFSLNWISLIEKNAKKSRNKQLAARVLFAVGLSRLVWVYLYRCPETLNNTTRTLHKVIGLYVNSKRKENWITTDLELINPLSDVLVTIGHAYPNFVVEHAMIPLVRQSFNGSNLDGINYEKLILAINTYRGLLMTNKKPEFPENDSRFYELGLNDISIKKSEALLLNHEEICSHFYKLFLILDSKIGCEVWSPENQHNREPPTPFEKFSFSFTHDNNTNNNRNLNVALFATLIETIPSCLCISAQMPFKSAIEVLSRNAVHADLLIATSCENALKALASKRNPYTVITWFAKYSFDFDEKTQSSYNMSYLSSSEYRKLLMLYVELLECWLEEFQSGSEDVKRREATQDAVNLGPDLPDTAEPSEMEMLELKNTATVIEEVEGNGLFFLCSQDPAIRKLSIQILRITSRFDRATIGKATKMSNGHSRSSSRFAADSGTRLVDLLNDSDYNSLVDPKKVFLSDVEKSRISKLTSKYKKGMLIKLAESEYGVDAALWQRVFPKLLSVIFESCPVTMALCRSIVCIRLVQVHEIILQIANKVDGRVSDVSPEAVTNQWKLYLIVACTSLTSTNDQKLHIPTASPQHGRKKSQQIFTVQHQKIKSATSIFKMVLPLLNAKCGIVRDAIIAGLSSMNVNIYRAYIENVDKFLTSWKISSTTNKIRVEMFHVLTILSRFLHNPTVLEDEWALSKISAFLKHVKRFLEEETIQSSYTYQPLRSFFAEFLKNYCIATKAKGVFKKSLPFAARASCFNYLKEWCGYGEYAYVAEERYATMIRNVSNSRDRTTITAGIEFQKSRLEKVALECMVVLCSDPITEKLNSGSDLPIIVSFDIGGLLSWIEALFNASDEAVRLIGVRALENLLGKNKENSKLFRDVALQCVSYHKQPIVSTLYYTTFCKIVLEMDDLILDEDELVSLGLYGLVSDKEETRTYAVDLLCVVESQLHNSSYTKVFKERLASTSKSVYKSTAKEISSIFAELLSQDLCLKIFSNLVRILGLFAFDIKKDLLILMVPWVNKFILKSFDEPDTFMALNNLFYITIDLNDKLPLEVEQLWISLGKGNSLQNIHVSLEYIITLSINHRNPAFVQHAKDVVLYLANVPGGIGLIDTLLQNLEPKYMVPVNTVSTIAPADNGKFSFVADIWGRLDYHGKSITFSKAHLSIIFLVNLASTPSESLKGSIPTLLHISICLLDHYMPLIQESASKVICDLIFSMAPGHEKSDATVKMLRDKHSLWSYDNLMKDKNGARSPKAMDALTRNILSIFSQIDGFHAEWQRISLKWATTCSVRHIACRSFQVFRPLLTFVDQGMLRDMLHRLSNTISDVSPDIQGFAMQILMTLNAVTAELDPADLINFPQLFWSITACLNSIHEQEFIEVLSCFTKFLSKIDLDAPDTVQCLVATFPSNWEGRFEGLQQIVMTGLRSANSLDITWKFLDKLNLLKDSRIVANSESRLLFALIANLPRFLHAMSQRDFTSIQPAIDALTNLSEAYKQPSLSRLIDSLSRNKFRSKKDFMSQVVSFISRNYFPEFSGQTLVFLLRLLLNKIGWVKVETMEILKYIFPLVDLKRPEFTGVGADLISPLLRLLLTEYETQALEVLDCVTNVSGSKLDKDVLRISMGNKDIKASGTITTTLFGIPEESGWSVPMPTMTAATTRHNVHAVFMTCAVETHGEASMEQPPAMDDIVEFHADTDYGFGRTETNDSVSLVEEKDASLSHMWAELDNLDSFFTKTTVSASVAPHSGLGILHDRTNSVETTQTEQTSTFESAPQLYDKKVSALLNGSLTKINSNVSFKKSLADSFTVSTPNEKLVSEPALRTAYHSPHLYGEDTMAPRSRNSNVLKSPGNAVLGAVSSSRSKAIESPQDTLFRFEGFLKSSQRSSRRKWQYHQQHQQLLSQTIHEQNPQSPYEGDSITPPLRASSASPVLPLNATSVLGNNVDNLKGKQGIYKQNSGKSGTSKSNKHQKLYHLPHFSSSKTQTWINGSNWDSEQK
ncbi:hypothetical protein HG536_0B02900 [Torulaspora globosa]|uniref:Uncharacterized protein n=1 Tax=Torulaspora globosa TaxID=48254 RepID=A0A7G3ZD41_9SACH|nr:uncharacterized protein HG536_0B02900 [Torulaspora globosa]QLL31427.1 hypothetical protein HG536_0B02900 [Torulaspora globosa]